MHLHRSRSLRQLLPISILLLGFLVWLRPASAQQPVSVDPYEVLYGKRLPLPQKPIPEPLLAPSTETIALVSTRSEAMLARLHTLLASLGQGGASVDRSIQNLHAQVRALDATDSTWRPFARQHSVSQLFLFAEVWQCFTGAP